MKKEIVKKEEFIDTCSKCNKVIRGTSEKQVEYNMGLHKGKHKK